TSSREPILSHQHPSYLLTSYPSAHRSRLPSRTLVDPQALKMAVVFNFCKDILRALGGESIYSTVTVAESAVSHRITSQVIIEAIPSWAEVAFTTFKTNRALMAKVMRIVDALSPPTVFTTLTVSDQSTVK